MKPEHKFQLAAVAKNMTRTFSDDVFKIPLQGKYLNDISNLKTDYNTQNLGSANAENQVSDNNKRKK